MKAVKRGPLLIVITTVLAAGVTTPAAQTTGAVRVRVALVWQSVLNEHREAGVPFIQRPIRSEFRIALESGVVDRMVRSRQWGVIYQERLVSKPMRVLTGSEAAALGGIGEFQLIAVRRPAGGTGWTEVEILPRAGQPDGVLVLEIGGELHTMTQVLAAIVLIPTDGSFVELELAPPAIIQRSGVLVVTTPFGRPIVRRDVADRFRGPKGVEFLVVRSPVETMVDAASTPRGPADASPPFAARWQEGDRVFVRLSLVTVRAAPSAIVLGWKDRVALPPLGSER